jgi:hypothetical protein
MRVGIEQCFALLLVLACGSEDEGLLGIDAAGTDVTSHAQANTHHHPFGPMFPGSQVGPQ